MRKFLLLLLFLNLINLHTSAQSPGVYSPGGSCVYYQDGNFTLNRGGFQFMHFDTAVSFANYTTWAGYPVSPTYHAFKKVLHVNEGGTDYLIWSGYTSIFDTIYYPPDATLFAIIAKTTLDGDTVWTHVYDDNSGIGGGIITLANDSNYLIGMNGFKGNVAKIDRNTGDTLWTIKNVYSFAGLDNRNYIWSMAVNNDSSFYFGGIGYPIVNACFMLMKTDTLGNAEWVKAYGDTMPVFSWGGTQCNDGGLILTGHPAIDEMSMTDTLWYHDFMVIRTNANGDTLWCRNYDNNMQVDKAYSIVETDDRGFAILGTSHSWTLSAGGNSADVHYTMLLLKIDSIGNPQWAKTYDPGFINQAYFINELRQSSSNGFYWSDDAFVHVTDSQGNNCMAQPANITVRYPQITIYPMVTYRENALDDIYPVHPHEITIASNQIDYCQYLGNSAEVITFDYFRVYPIPSGGDVTIEWNAVDASDASVSVSNITGQEVYQNQWPVDFGFNRKEFSLKGLNPGIYFIEVTSGNQVSRGKIVLE